MNEATAGLGSGSLYAIAAIVLGLVGLGLAAVLIPRLVQRFFPHIDEQREIARGNQAVAEYFGRIISAAILGVSIIIAAGLFVGLH
jgi:hypothetical protein